MKTIEYYRYIIYKAWWLELFSPTELTNYRAAPGVEPQQVEDLLKEIGDLESEAWEFRGPPLQRNSSGWSMKSMASSGT